MKITNTDAQSVEAAAQSMVDDATHYVDSVSAMAGNYELSATQDIVSASGVKLVARGTRIDERMRERLRDHRLSGSTLERSLSIAGGLTPDSLAHDQGKLIDEDGWLTRLEAKSGEPGVMRNALSHLDLPPEILFRLTVARDQRLNLYRHSLSVAAVSHYLGLRLHLKQSAINNLLVAALCHDLGELYTSPSILEPGHRVTDEERRYIYVHPITGWLLVCELPGLDAAVATAVIQHQERLDGSGYPNGRKAAAIGLAGRIVAIADVSASIMARFSDHRRLSMLLRLNSKKYDRKIVDLLHDTIVTPTPSAIGQLERSTVTKRLAGFALLLEGWSRLRMENAASPAASLAVLSERIYNLRTVVLDFGFDPDSLEITVDLAEQDATIAAELTMVVDEMQFQLADLAREFDRQAQPWRACLDATVATAMDEWRRQLQVCIDN